MTANEVKDIFDNDEIEIDPATGLWIRLCVWCGWEISKDFIDDVVRCQNCGWKWS